jgi:hypothetical protein
MEVEDTRRFSIGAEQEELGTCVKGRVGREKTVEGSATERVIATIRYFLRAYSAHLRAESQTM